ncbi:MAG: hypothetical protein M1816_006172 [Peltula sp. TS41687]|nr:MAG: hypothetical protein M1816_006172 [Peltula sp. TS41687]
MAVLFTGGTGKTSVRIAALLQEANIPYLLASRRGEAAAPAGMPAVKFDWLDSSTFAKPFQHQLVTGAGGFRAVYLIAPVVADPATPMNAFVDYAVKEHGVTRFVVMGGSTTEPDAPHHVGKVWKHLIDIGVEHCVLRPTWFMENFSEQDTYCSTIKDESKIYSACGDGKIPFISATDIAAVAFHALTDEKIHETEYRVLGPELLTYDAIAAKLSSCLGRKIVHVKLSPDQETRRLIKDVGMDEDYAKLLTYLEVISADGVEERMNDAVERVTGRPPLKFDDFAQQNKAVWE